MNCHWCFGQESQSQSYENLQRNSLPYKNLYLSDQIKKSRQLSRINQQKISLKKKQTISSFNLNHVASNTHETQYVRNVTSPSTIYSMTYRPFMIPESNIYSPQKQKVFISRPVTYTPKAYYTPSISFINQRTNKVKKPQSQKTQQVPSFLKTKHLNSTKVSFTHRQIDKAPRQNINNFQHSSVIEPIQVQNKVIMETNTSKKIQKQKSHHSKQQLIQLPPIDEEKKQINKLSNVVNFFTPQKQSFFVRKLHTLQFKKQNSATTKNIQDEGSHKLAQSLRAFRTGQHLYHLQDIQCKKTQSVADAEKQSDQFSIIIRDDAFPSQNQRKMTSSQTNMFKSSRNSLQEPNRSIVLQPSRKQSYNQL